MNSLDHLTKMIAFKIVLPVVFIFILMAGILYVFVLRGVSDFAEQHIKEDILNLSHEVYNIVDRNLTELLREGQSDDEGIQILIKGNTLDALEVFARKQSINLLIYSDGREMSNVGNFDKTFYDNASKKQGQISITNFKNKDYYTYPITFEPWNWQILLVKDTIAYKGIKDKEILAYLVTWIAFLLAAFVLIFSLRKTVITPLESLVKSLNKGESPRYKGTKEIEFLSTSISNMMDSLNEKIKGLETSQKELKALKEFNNTILNNINDVIFVIEADSLKITAVNEVFLKIYHTTLDEVIGKTCYEAVHQLSEQCPNCHAINIIAEGKGSIYEKSLSNKKGELRHVEISASPIKDETGSISHLVFASRDITERKRLEEQLRHSQKFESIGILAGGIAHDFNNILTGIIGYANLLQMKIGNESPISRYVEQILTSADRAAGLIRNLLAYSRKQIINPVSIDLNEAIKKVHGLLKRLLEANIELQINPSNYKLMVMADPIQIEQVLMNLATNARDAMPKGGRLLIETDFFEINDDFIKVYNYGTKGRYARITITDTGDGIDEKLIDKIFDPFFTTKQTGKGTGLGLSMVYGIIKQHNGFINVDSELGKGTNFRIYLPLMEPNVSETAELESKPMIAPNLEGSEIILLVEDEDFVREINAEVLTKFGYKVLESANGEEALQIFKEHKNKIELILTDIIMPKKNGWELLEEVKKIKPEMKVLLTSGYSQDLVDKDITIDKNVHFIAKPVSPINLLTKVKEILDEIDQKPK